MTMAAFVSGTLALPVGASSGSAVEIPLVGSDVHSHVAVPVDDGAFVEVTRVALPDGRALAFEPPLDVRVEPADGFFIAMCPAIWLNLAFQELDAVEEIVHDEIAFMWLDYVDAPTEKIADDARPIRDALLRLGRVEPA